MFSQMTGSRLGKGFVIASLLASAGLLGVLVMAPLSPAAPTMLPNPVSTAVAGTSPETTAAPSGTGLGVPGSPLLTAPLPSVVATRIVIPRLEIDLPVVEGDGIDAPLHQAAHYPGSSWPGGGSNIYLYAHARQNDFQPLWDAELGDRIFLEVEDGSDRIYEVTEIRPDVPWDALEVLDPTPSEQLTLQTCTGTEPTDPRFLVIAVPAA